jgi:hypothetical protein
MIAIKNGAGPPVLMNISLYFYSEDNTRNSGKNVF